MLLKIAAVLACLAVAVTIAQNGPSVSIQEYRAGLRVQPFTNMPPSNFFFIDGATVSIEIGYVPEHDQLFFDYQGDFPIQGQFSEENGVLYLSGRATTSEYSNAIASVVFVTTSEDGRPRQITYSLGDNTFFFTLTQHYYRYFAKSGLSWDDARAACNGTTFFNMRGYLATVTSSDEQAQLGAKANFTAWLGGSDVAEEGTWRWVTGPEGTENNGAGRIFWNGQSMYVGGAAPYNTFSAWNRFQPNNGDGEGEDYLYLVNSLDQETSYWADSTSVAAMEGFICEYGGLDSAAIAATVNQYSGTAQLFLECSLFTSPTECNNRVDFGCRWSAGLCAQTTCSRYHTQAECDNDFRCDWNTDGLMGVCANTQCAGYDATTCPSTSCTVRAVSGVQQCWPGLCADQTQSCTCNAMTGCVWREGRCGWNQGVDCSGMDVVYLLDGTLPMAEVFGRHNQGFRGLVDAFLDSQQVLTGTAAGVAVNGSTFGQRIGFIQYGTSVRRSPVGVGSGGRLTGSVTESQADLNFHMQNFLPRAGSRAINSALQAANDMFSGESRNRKRVVVIFTAGDISDAAAIARQFSANSATGGVLASLKNNNVSLVGVALRPTNPETLNSLAASAALNTLLGDGSNPTILSLTMGQVQSEVIYGMCGGTPLATELTTVPTSLLCSDYATPTQCSMNSMCAWDPAAKMCANSACLLNCDTATCGANPTCDAVGSDCVELCSGLNETQCGETDGVGFCRFDYDLWACEPVTCVSNPTEDGCIADTNDCQFNPIASPMCEPLPCATDNSETCLLLPGCKWNGIACYQDICQNLTNSARCGNFVQCQWNAGSNVCETKDVCGYYTDEMQCANDFRCSWDVSQPPGACGPAKCTYFNVDPASAKGQCQSDPDCYWQPLAENNLRDMCIRKTCDLMKSSCDCTSLDGCVWRNGTCKDNRFVQCPAIDVVFLVEGTPTMLRAFGRHPNGYYGIVESIRSWSTQAPFAVTEDLSGFRVALVNYGAPRLALSVPPSIGSGGNLTGDLNKWVGTDQDLDWNEQHIEDYATNGNNGNVAIKPALIKALNIFQTSGANPDRKKLVVILGHNAITDGDKNLNKEITQLEAMGVHIFANILRRFSEITPVDLKNAEFMRPLASDPPTVHFSFTTIDDMKANLLEKFCDPSTGTGEILGVSRDNELPCSWLSGATECNIQGSCSWNASASLQCPEAGQCANLGCIRLPASLDGKFDCQNCRLVSGALQCSLGKNYAAPRGLCQKAACMYNCDGMCTSTACDWNAPSLRCERKMCTYPNSSACNADLGCVWNQDSTSGLTAGTCERSVCGRLRSTDSCTALSIPEGLFQYTPCMMNEQVTPAICVQQRCPKLNKDSCEANEASSNPVCEYIAAANGRKCATRVCTYTTSEQCEMDSTCYWDNFEQSCHRRIASCVLSGYSEWAPCTASCGSATTYKMRTIIQFPTGQGSTCDVVANSANCQNPDGTTVANCGAGDTAVTVIRSCALNSGWVPDFPSRPQVEGEWPANCVDYCALKTSQGRLSCIQDNSCMWIGSTCQVKPFMGCVTLNQSACSTSDMCAFDTNLGVCKPVVSVCQYDTQSECVSEMSCQWKDGSNALSLANSLGLNVQLVNPGQAPIYPFTTLAIDSEDMINGATVIIETNYQRGKDLLDISFAKEIRAEWVEQSGMLRMYGTATVADYARAIRFVSFQTTSTRKVARTITWSFGNNTVYSSTTKHHYRAVSNMGATYEFAKAWCAGKTLYGLSGYLATIMSQAENDLVTSKALGVGWISGDDKAVTNSGSGVRSWRISTGPEVGTEFWIGGSVGLGGQAVATGYANWFLPNATNINGEPLLNVGAGGSTGQNRVYLSRSGFWESRLLDSIQVDGYICEFGGMPTDTTPPYPIGGATMVGVGGCITSMCIWHNSQSACDQDIECAWVNGVCQAGCASFGTESECQSSSAGCRWDTAVLPPTCDINACARLSVAACALDSRCQWMTNDVCDYREGCPRFNNARECNNEPTCLWASSCMDRPCSSYTDFRRCRQNAQCRWDGSKSTCLQAFCLASSQAACVADRNRCMWNQADTMTVGFSPNGAVIQPFASGIEPPTDITTLIDGVTVAIVEGFQKGSDILKVDAVDNVDQLYLISYDAINGVLRIRPNTGVQLNSLTAFNFLRRSVKFSSDSTSSARRRIAFVYAANAVYSPDSRKFLKYLGRTANTFADAQALCRAESLFGVRGNLATIRNEGDNQYLLRLRAKGWIAASSDNSNVWSWTLASGNTSVFWIGQGALGKPTASQTMSGFSLFNFARWGSGQPALPNTFGYFTEDGTWMVIKENVFPMPSGVICEFDASAGSMTSAIYGFRNAAPVGCFVAPCLSLPQTQCQADVTCAWRADLNNGQGGCALDTACLAGSSPTQCSMLELCQWDFDRGLCRSSIPSLCTSKTSNTSCAATKGCEWNPFLVPRNSARSLGACVFQGCQKYTDLSTCNSDATCQWTPSSGPCVSRLCGYQSPGACWRDSLCMWKKVNDQDTCAPTPCSAIQSDSVKCGQTDGCAFNETLQRCEYRRCSSTGGKATCQADTACLWLNGQCTMPNCDFVTQDSCQKVPECYFSIQDKKCLAQQCMSNMNKEDCEGQQNLDSKRVCRWEAAKSFCRQATYAELRATADVPDTCQNEKNPNFWWLWLLLAIIIMLVGVIFYRLYLAYARGQNFFEPTRKNYKYSPHQMYASELFEEAKVVGQETNLIAPGY